MASTGIISSLNIYTVGARIMPFCPKCGNQFDEQDRFCRNCGFELGKEDITIESSDAGLEYEKDDDIPLIQRSRWYQRLWFGIGIATGVVLLSLGLPPSTYQNVAFFTSGVALLAAIVVWFRSRREYKQK
jgi:hypothetical protein